MRLKVLYKNLILFVFTACIILVCFALVIHAIFPRKYNKEVTAICDNVSISPNLVFALIKAESSFKKDATSQKGAIGLMQIMPDTASYVSDLFFAGERFDLYDEKDNIIIGVTYLLYLFNKFEDKKTVLCAYNAGEGRVYEWLQNHEYSYDGKTINYIPFEETKSYVEKIIRYEKFYDKLYK